MVIFRSLTRLTKISSSELSRVFRSLKPMPASLSLRRKSEMLVHSFASNV